MGSTEHIFEAFIQKYCLHGISSILCIGNCKNNIFSLSETSLILTRAFNISKTDFHKSGPFKSIKNMLKSFQIM